MPKAARISTPASRTSSSTNSDSVQFISVALFSGIGLLISLVVVLLGVQGVTVVCHGASTSRAVMNAVRLAGRLAESGLVGALAAATTTTAAQA